MMAKIKVAVVGVGRMGALLEEDKCRYKPYTHLGGYLAVPECEVVAIADKDLPRAHSVGEKYRIHNVFEDGKEMVQKCQIDLVSVCTPTETHFDVVMDVAPYVKAVFCEKPITDDVVTAKKMVEACKRYNTILAVNHTKRWHPLFQDVKKRIDEGEIGKLLRAVGYFSGDFINDGIHMFDLFNWYKPLNYTCIPCETDYLIFELDLIGTDGRIRIEDNGRRLAKYGVLESTHYKGYKELLLSDVLVDFQNFRHLNPMINAVRDLISCIQKGGAPKCTGQNGLEALTMCIGMAKRI